MSEDGGLVEVQWHNGGASGARSWKLYGVTKVHLWQGEGRTLCGRKVARRSDRLTPRPSDDRCKVCAIAAEEEG